MRDRPAPPRAATTLICLFLLFLLQPPETFAARGGQGGKDRTAPTLTVASPADGLETSDPALTVSGTAADDKALAAVDAAVNGGTPIQLPLAADGAFAGEVGLDPGTNSVAVTARDAAGNTTAVTRTVTLSVGPSPVTITSPRDGDVIYGSFVDVQGTYEAPVETMGLMTLYGLAEGGSFHYPSYPLEEGENVVTFGGKDSDGNQYLHEITVTRIGGGEPAVLVPDRQSGEAPLTVNFQVATDTLEMPTLCEIDYLGDGTFSALADCAKMGAFTYVESRAYRPSLRVHTAEGHRYTATAHLSVHGPATYLGEFPAADPVDMAADAAGNIYVLEGASGRVVVMDESGAVLRAFGSAGSGDGQFQNPSSIAIDPDGRVYVSDTGNSRVQFFSPAGTFLGKWGRHGTKYGQINLPRGIAINGGGEMILADSGNGRVEVMRRESGYRERSVGEEELSRPVDVLWLPGVDFAVIDEDTARVLVYSPYGGAPKALREEAGPFVSPAGLSFDRHNGFVVIADRGAHSVVLADYDHEAFVTMRVISAAAGDPRAFSAPVAALRGTAPHEDIYFIADSGNDRIVKVRLEKGPSEGPQRTWQSVREALSRSDIEGALAHFSLQTQEVYRHVLTEAQEELPQVVADMGELHPLSVSQEKATYGVLRYDNEKPYLFEVHFVHDGLGGWKILYW